MSPRFPLSVVAAISAVALLWQSAATAQTVVPPPGGVPGEALESMQAPKDLPRPQRSDHTRNLDFLFGALKAAPDAEAAKHVENRIWALWLASGSDTSNLLMTRVKTAVEAKDFDLAVKLLDAVVEIRPDYIEAWNRRATIHYMQKNFGQSMLDIQQVLRREPRHFGAISGLGMILQEFGDEQRALAAFRRALEIHPHMPKIPEIVKGLTEKVEGRDI
jgi:tetratricopeptide (TPR) repeat protein